MLSPATSTGISIAISCDGKNGPIAGIGGLSSVGWSECAWAAHRLGCCMSMPAQSGMEGAMAADAAALSEANIGQAYADTASCANSKAHKAIRAVRWRTERGSFMVSPIIRHFDIRPCIQPRQPPDKLALARAMAVSWCKVAFDPEDK